jgi:hypothetical protein
MRRFGLGQDLSARFKLVIFGLSLPSMSYALMISYGCTNREKYGHEASIIDTECGVDMFDRERICPEPIRGSGERQRQERLAREYINLP